MRTFQHPPLLHYSESTIIQSLTVQEIDAVLNHFSNNMTLDIKKFKSLASTSRKYAVPLLEYLDKLDITYRDKNERKLKKRNI